jgi:hypothetical protein
MLDRFGSATYLVYGVERFACALASLGNLFKVAEREMETRSSNLTKLYISSPAMRRRLRVESRNAARAKRLR